MCNFNCENAILYAKIPNSCFLVIHDSLYVGCKTLCSATPSKAFILQHYTNSSGLHSLSMTIRHDGVRYGFFNLQNSNRSNFICPSIS